MEMVHKSNKSHNKFIAHNQLAKRKKPKEQLMDKVSEIFADLRQLGDHVPNEKKSFDMNSLKPALKATGNAITDYVVPGAAGLATGLGAHAHGFGPFESTMLGLAGGAIADPKAYVRAFQNRNIDPSLGGPVSGFFAGMKKPLMNKALLAGIGLAPSAAKSVTGILHDSEKTTHNVAQGTEGFAQTGQDIQKGLSETSKNLGEASGSIKDLTGTLTPATQAIAKLPGIMQGHNENTKKLFGVLAGGIGVTGAYLVINRLAKLKERVEKERTKQLNPPALHKKKKITIDPGDYNIDFGALNNTMGKAADYNTLRAMIKNAIQR